MSWQDATETAAQRMDLLRLPDGKLEGFTVTLLDYADEEVFRYAGNARSLKYHRMVNQALWRLLKKRGVYINTKTLDWQDFLRVSRSTRKEMAYAKEQD